jgi:hypothetical protein
MVDQVHLAHCQSASHGGKYRYSYPADPELNPMNEGIPRPLLVLTVVVVLAAIFLGIKDHFRKPIYAPPAPNPIAASDIANLPKKVESTKAKPARKVRSATKSSLSGAESAAEDIEEQRITGTYSDADARALLVAGHARHAGHASNLLGSVKDAREQADAAVDANTTAGTDIRTEDKKDTKIVKARFSEPQCVPLPNSVVPGDVDAPYYENWAKEYSCHLP